MIEKSIDKISFSHDGIGDALSSSSYYTKKKDIHIPVQRTTETIPTLSTHRKLHSISDRKYTDSKFSSAKPNLSFVSRAILNSFFILHC